MRKIGAVLVALAGCGPSAPPLAIPKPSEFSPELRVQRLKPGQLPRAWTTPFSVPAVEIVTSHGRTRAVIFSNNPLYAPE